MSKNKRTNNGGFTLIELLAVIVILALIMGIAVTSVGAVLSNSRKDAFVATAISYIEAVRNTVIINSTEPAEAGTKYYTLNSSLLQSGGVVSPFGGSYQVATSGAFDPAGVTTPVPTCTIAGASSYVKITNTSGVLSYSICLVDGKYGINFIGETTLARANVVSAF